MPLGGPADLGYEIFDRGNRAGPYQRARPCSAWFLKALLSDLSLWTRKLFVCMIYELTKGDLTVPLSSATTRAALTLTLIMVECRRLRSEPELFPSAYSRKRFLDSMAEFARIVKIGSSTALEVAAKIKKHLEAKAVYAFKYNGTWYRINQSTPVNLGPMETRPWNEWFDNKCITDEKVVQRFPEIGSVLADRLRLINWAVLRDFARARQIVRRRKQTPLILADATGENHFWDVAEYHPVKRYMGYCATDYKVVDSNGVMTLECLSLQLALFQGREVPPDGFYCNEHLVTRSLRPDRMPFPMLPLE